MMRAYSCLFLAAFFWGTSFVAGKFSFSLASAPLIVLGRFFIASLFWFPFFMTAIKRVPKGRFRALFFLSFLMIPVTFLLQFMGLQETDATSAALMIGFEPLMIVLIGAFFWKEPLTQRNLILSLIAFLGVLLVMGYPQDARFLGCALVLLSTVVVAFWVHLSKKWMQDISARDFTALTTVLGTALLLPSVFLLSPDLGIRFSMEGVIALLYLGIACSLLAGWLWNAGLQNTKAAIGGLFLALEPVFGVVFATTLLSESLNLRTFLGVFLVLIPIMISAITPLLQKEGSAKTWP